VLSFETKEIFGRLDVQINCPTQAKRELERATRMLTFPNDATAALSKADLELESLQAASIQNRKILSPEPPQRGVGLRRFARRYRWHLLLFAVLLAIFLYLKSQG